MDEIKLRIEMGKNIARRGGSIIHNIFKKADKKLNGKDALDIFNVYGMRIENIMVLASSHGFEVDEDGFVKMLDEQEKRHEKTVKALTG